MSEIPESEEKIRPTNGCLFIHIPRTAGNSIKEVTGCWHGHFLARWLKEIFPKWDNLWTFSIIRNPWQLAVSWWCLCRKKKMIMKTFDRWVRENNNPWSKIDAWKSLDPINQWEYISEDSEVIVKHVGRFENLQKEWELIREKMGIKNKKLPVKEATKHNQYRKYYTDETVEIIRARNKKLLEVFPYEF